MVYVEALITTILDCAPALYSKKSRVSLAVCFALYLMASLISNGVRYQPSICYEHIQEDKLTSLLKMCS